MLASKETFGDSQTTLADLVADNPAEMQKLYEHWQAEHKAGRIKAPTFEAYLRKLMPSKRGEYGEFQRAFDAGPKEILVKAPKGVNEPGTDMLSYSKADDRIRYNDNKAYGEGRNVDEVSALEWNILDNINDDIAVIEKAVKQGAVRNENVPPEIEQKVLPRLKDAAREIAEYIQKNINPKQSSGKRKEQLARPKHQKAIDNILDNNGIDRIVTGEGGSPNLKLTQKLSAKGFEQQ